MKKELHPVDNIKEAERPEGLFLGFSLFSAVPAKSM